MHMVMLYNSSLFAFFRENTTTFFPIVAYSLQLCSLSRIGWFIFLLERKEMSADFPSMFSWRLCHEPKTLPTTFCVEFVSTLPIWLISAVTQFYLEGLLGATNSTSWSFSVHFLLLSSLIIISLSLSSIFPSSLSLLVTIYIYIYIVNSNELANFLVGWIIYVSDTK